MIVRLIAHLEPAKNETEYLNVILDAIKSQGHSLAQDWITLEHYREAQNDPKTGKRKLDWGQIYHESIDAIEKSDVVIAESSGFGCFDVGYQAALAVQKKKPLLILRRPSLKSEQGSMSVGIDDPLVQVADYETAEELIEAVQTFLYENTTGQKDLRFNFVIDRQIHNHLRWRSFKTGKTKAEVVRDLLMKDIESNS